jgi:selenocysteine lyase/cysteine desulfurase
MLYHSVGQYRDKGADMARALADFSAAWARIDGGQWPYALGVIGRYVSRWQEMIGADAGTVTPTENVTSAVSALVNALPERHLRGRTVLVAEDCFPSNHFLLAGLADRLGFTLRTVPLRQGASWVEDEDLMAQWTPEVGLALLTWVSSVSSHRCDLGSLVAHGRRMGSLIGVDITQAAGLLPFDAKAPAVDFAVSTSLKWTCGSPGAGMLYVAPALIPQCLPRLRGWFSQPDPFNWDITRFSYAPDIRRFDHGTPGVMACAATLPALDWHAGMDAAALRAHNLSLCAALQSGLQDLGLRLASPLDPGQRGGSVMAQLPSTADVASALEALAAADVQADGRGRALRLSPGILTTMAGVERALQVLRSTVP